MIKKWNAGWALAGVVALAGALQIFAQSRPVAEKPQQAQQPKSGEEKAQQQTPVSAVAVLHPTAGNTARGVVSFTREASGLHIVAKLTDVPPGQHGFHIHEFGDCSAPDAVSAGEHFNPTGGEHAAAGAHAPHAGDLGNVQADSSGRANFEQFNNHLSFEGVTNFIGRSIVLHAQADDLRTQPSGNSGARIACGVIGVNKAGEMPATAPPKY